MMFELLWVSNIDEVNSELTRPTMLWDRWNGRNNTSPLGLVFRSSNEEVPFESWEYKPKYLPDEFSFLVGNNAGILNEPVIFKMPDGVRLTPEKNHRLQKLSGFNSVSSLYVGMPKSSSQSSKLKSIGCLEKISFKESQNHV